MALQYTSSSSPYQPTMLSMGDLLVDQVSKFFSKILCKDSNAAYYLSEWDQFKLLIKANPLDLSKVDTFILNLQTPRVKPTVGSLPETNNVVETSLVRRDTAVNSPGGKKIVNHKPDLSIGNRKSVASTTDVNTSLVTATLSLDRVQSEIVVTRDADGSRNYSIFKEAKVTTPRGSAKNKKQNVGTPPVRHDKGISMSDPKATASTLNNSATASTSGGTASGGNSGGTSSAVHQDTPVVLNTRVMLSQATNLRNMLRHNTTELLNYMKAESRANSPSRGGTRTPLRKITIHSKDNKMINTIEKQMQSQPHLLHRLGSLKVHI
jgi:hypothetical protein